MSNPIENGQVARILYFAVREGKAIDDIPGLVKRIIKGEMWKDLLIKETGEVVNFKTFIEFITTQPPEGLGTTLDTIKRLGSHDTEMITEVDRVIQGKLGAPKGNKNASKTNVDIIHNCSDIDRPTGTSLEAGLRRLRKSRKDLHTRVLAHEISVNAAMVEAGFRPKTITIPVDPGRAAQAIKRQFTQEQIEELVEFLQDDS